MMLRNLKELNADIAKYSKYIRLEADVIVLHAPGPCANERRFILRAKDGAKVGAPKRLLYELSQGVEVFVDYCQSRDALLNLLRKIASGVLND